MIIRPMTPEDMRVLSALNKLYHPTMQDPEFHDNFVTKFVVEDNGELILGCGMRRAEEVIVVTDKSQNVHTTVAALLKTLAFCRSQAKFRQTDFLYAFVDDGAYKNHLLRHGFEKIDGIPLSYYTK